MSVITIDHVTKNQKYLVKIQIIHGFSLNKGSLSPC